MQQTPFHAYYAARMLCSLPDDEKLLPVYASSDIEAYPFQIAASAFALHSPHQKGVILCDEAGMGKSHEAMLIAAQMWLSGSLRILICIPNADLLTQWIGMLEKYYTVPYVVLRNTRDIKDNTTEDNPNPFDQAGIVVTTYDFAADHEADASAIKWQLAVFEEANALSGVYQESSKQAKALYRISGDAFKLLLTGTPIEKNIMDLYGLIWFIDNTVFPDEKDFLTRYLRKPENYPDLASRVSRYCYRTLRSQAKRYAKLPERILLTVEYAPSENERRLYDLLYQYINRPGKLAFPEMDPYELALRLLGILSSSTAAITQTLEGIIRRLQKEEHRDGEKADAEIAELNALLDICGKIELDSKASALLELLDKGFASLKKSGAARKAVIFTESAETQKMLGALLREKYDTAIYNGGADYSAIQRFKSGAEILISTDSGAKGFNLEEASFVIHYDLPYNTMKLEQRIDRCHRIGQKHDVISAAFINKHNFSDVRKLELVSKRVLVSDGVFGISEDVIGGFTDNIPDAMKHIARRLRSAEQVEADFRHTLTENADENRQLVASAEDMLFTTFTRQLAEKIHLSPSYIDERKTELNDTLWELAKWFFTRYNERNTDCYFVIDEDGRTVTATNCDTLPVLFYYWDGSRNKKYRSQRAYGMATDFKPKFGRITMTSIIGQGILRELECADKGELTLGCEAEPCTIGLYNVTVMSNGVCAAEYSVLAGRTDSGETMTEERCAEYFNMPVSGYTQSDHSSPHWLKSTGSPRYDPLDRCVDTARYIQEQARRLCPDYDERKERLKARFADKKTELSRIQDDTAAKIRQLEEKRAAITGDRLTILKLDKQLTVLRRELMKQQQDQFINEIRIDSEYEEELNKLSAKENITVQVVREFIIKLRHD